MSSNSIDTKIAPNSSKHLARGIIAADLFTIHDDDAASSEVMFPAHNDPSALLIGSAGQQMSNRDGSRRYDDASNVETNSKIKSSNSFDKNVNNKMNIVDVSPHTDDNERNAD